MSSEPGKVDRPISQRSMSEMEDLRAENAKLRKRLQRAHEVITGLTELLNEAREELETA
jgi:hypothetical protein